MLCETKVFKSQIEAFTMIPNKDQFEQKLVMLVLLEAIKKAPVKGQKATAIA